jgi:hypothetical protein
MPIANIWSQPYNFYFGGMALDASNIYFYSGTNQTITQTNFSTGIVIDSSFSTGFSSLGYLAIDNNYIYVSDSGTQSTIWKVDIANPVTPEIFFDASLNIPLGVAILDGYLYVSSSFSNYISKISLSDPVGDNNIYWVQSDLIGGPQGIYIYNNLLYVSSISSSYIGGANVVSTIDIASATIIQTSSITYSIPYSLVVYNSYLYLSTHSSIDPNNSYVQQLDLSLNVINDTWAQVPYANGLLVSGTDLYCSDDGNTQLDAGIIYKISLIEPPSPPVACFKEGSKILTDKGYVPIQDLRSGDLVKTLLNDYKPISMIGFREMDNPSKQERTKDQLYKCSPEKYPELFEDLVITGCHSILVENFLDETQRNKIVNENGCVYITDDKYRLPAYVDEKASVYEVSGKHTIYHLALEHDDYYMNYGIYANGLLVETCSKRYLKELSNMTLL